VAGTEANRVAYAHIAFNLLLAIVGLCLLTPIRRITEWLVPVPPASKRKGFGPRYISAGPIGSVSLALGQSMREIMHAAEIVREMFRDMWAALSTESLSLAERSAGRDDQVDCLDTVVKEYLSKLSGHGLEPQESAEQLRQFRYMTDLETIGDIIDKNVFELVAKKIRMRAKFSAEGWAELNDFAEKIAENLLIADNVFATRDPMLAQELMRHRDRLSELEHELRDRHFARLNSGLVESHETSAIHLDLLTHLKRINSCVSHVAYQSTPG
jgi:phosphate:Na+ symporter